MLGSGVPAMPGRHTADDLPDGHDEEQLTRYGLNYCEGLSRIGRRHQVPVADGRQGDEAKE